MKNVIALTLLFVIGAIALIGLAAAAQAKLAPMQAQPSAFRPDDLAIATGASGATIEQDYLRATPSAKAAGSIFPCRLHIFAKTRLAQSCH